MPQNTLLVRLKNIKNESMIRAYYTENMADTIKMYKTIIDNDVSMYVGVENFDHPDGYSGEQVFPKEMDYTFGGKDSLCCLDIWVEV